MTSLQNRFDCEWIKQAPGIDELDEEYFYILASMANDRGEIIQQQETVESAHESDDQENVCQRPQKNRKRKENIDFFYFD